MPSVTRSAPSARKSGDGKARRRQVLESQLLEATEKLMSEGHTFTELSVERLATAAGTSRATFYVYFKDKSVLLQSFAEHVLTEVADAARPWWQVATERNPIEIRRAMERIIATYRKHEHILNAVIETAAYDPQVASAYHQLIERNAAGVVTLIEQGQAAGQIRPMASTQAASVLTWMVERACNQLIRNTPPESDAQLAETLADLLWGALYLEPLPGLPSQDFPPAR